MGSLKKVLESTGIPAQRGVYTGKQKPKAYYTFLLITRDTAASADDKEAEAGNYGGLHSFTRAILKSS